MALSRSVKEKELLEQRRDGAFNTLLELLAERRQILSMVQDNADLMGMSYLNAKSDIQSQRLEAHVIMDKTVKVWSNKLSFAELSSSDPEAKRDAEY